jgi:arylsulfatase A-like enzyme
MIQKAISFNFGFITFLLIAAGILDAAQLHSDSKENPPNILVFVADDAGMDFGAYGNDQIHTPNIDRLAANGLMFENAFLTSSQCSPSRTSMLSGLFAHTIGTEDLHTGLSDTTRILPNYLGAKGYFTGIMLKAHIGSNGIDQFDWYDEGFRPDYVEGRWFDKAQDNFKKFLDRGGERPFFMWVGFVDPHRPYAQRESVEANRAPRVNDSGNVEVPPYLVDSPGTREDLAHYYDEITRMDQQIGEFITVLERQDRKKNTLIVFLSDNGYPFPRGKATLYDDGIQTPLIFSWPGKIGEELSYSGLTSTIDLAPTLLDIAGIGVPEQMYGKSLKPILWDQSIPGRKYVFAERNWHNTDAHMRAVRTANYKLIINGYTNRQFPITAGYGGVKSWTDLLEARENMSLTPAQTRIFEYPRPKSEFYDLRNDPYETRNLAVEPEYQEMFQEMRNAMSNWKEATRDYPPHMKRKGDNTDRTTGYNIQTHKLEYWD